MSKLLDTGVKFKCFKSIKMNLFTRFKKNQLFSGALLFTFLLFGIVRGNAQCPAAAGCLEGNAFDDINCNGLNDSENGVQGVQVLVYDSNNNQVQSGLTDSNGNWQFCGLSNGSDYRVEFILPAAIDAWANPSHAGSDNGTDVRFLTVPNCADFGLSNPVEYCQSNPIIATSCFSYGTFDGPNATDPAFVAWPYEADGHDFNVANSTANYEADYLATINDIGAVYGLAWQPTRQKIYLGAYHKRFSGFGAAGPDAIYQFAPDGTLTGTIELDALLGVNNSAGSDVHDMVTESNGEVMDLGNNNSVYSGVGKRSFGDLEMSGDMTTVYVMNMFDRKIYAIDVTDGISSNASIVNSWDAPDETGSNRHRPFGLAWHQGKLWIGSVDDNGSNAFVHSLDITGTNFNLELTIPLGYERQGTFSSTPTGGGYQKNWQAWSNNPETIDYANSGGEAYYTQPMLSDIEFDGDDMILGFRDRFGDQSGTRKFLSQNDANNGTYTWGTTGGDILRACYNGTGFTLETGNGGACPSISGIAPSGPGGEEWYHWDYFSWSDNWDPVTGPQGTLHWETSQGGLLQLTNQPSVYTTAMDPFDDFSGGIIKLDNATGRREGNTNTDQLTLSQVTGGYTIYETGDYSTNNSPPVASSFAKANGLGDLEAFCDAAPLEIGNYVWCDTNRNGIQDAGENGLDDMVVQLYDANGNLIGQDVTSNGGQYFFNQNNVDINGITVDGSGNASPTVAWSGIDYSSDYFIVFGDSQFDYGVFTIGGTPYAGATTANVNSNSDDNVDSDVDESTLTTASNDMPAGLPFIAFTADPVGCANHKYDLGICNIQYDWGDLPDTSPATASLNYQTLNSNDGPAHVVIDGLYIGSTVDVEILGQASTDALGDGTDEDGFNFNNSLNITPGSVLNLPLNIVNTTGTVAHFEMWIDWNGDGDFDDAGEMVANLSDDGAGNFGPTTLPVTVPANAVENQQIGVRARLSHTNNMTPYGIVDAGEVEDYLIQISCETPICLPVSFTRN